MIKRQTPHESLQVQTKIIFLMALLLMLMAIFSSCINGRYTHFDGCRYRKDFVGYGK